MKKLLNIILAAGAAILAASCMEIDNFDAPSASVSGNVIDFYTGKNMLLDHGTTHIRIWERSYSTNPTPQDLAIKMDGSYANTKLFAGTYDMVPSDGAFWPCDTTYNVAIGKKGKVQDFTVKPYLHVEEFDLSLDGLSLTLKCRLFAPDPAVTSAMPQILEVRPFLSLNQHCGAGNRIDYYYTDAYRVNIRKNWDKIGNAEGKGDILYEITVPVKAGYTYWCRMGVQLNNTYKSWNYSEIKKIDIPSTNN